MSSTDAEAWEALRCGDPDGLTAIYRGHVDAMFGFAFRRTASRSEAEDVVQATFVSLWRKGRDGSLPALTLPTARPFLMRMAANECRNLIRSRRRRHALQERLHLRDAAEDLAEAVSERVDDERRMSDLRRALDTLPRGQQEAIELVVWSGLTTAEAAFALRVAEGTVKSRVSRGKARLEELLAESGKEEI